MHMEGKMMMHMSFYWGKDVTILFDWWRTKTWKGYCLSLLAIFLVSAFYQYLEDKRIALKIASLRKYPPPPPPSSLQSPFLLSPLRYQRERMARVVVAGMFGVNAAFGYLLMLAVMSFNWGVFIAVVLGLMFGYLAFRSGGEEDLVAVDDPCACA